MIDDLESTTAKLCSFARAYHSNYERNKVFDDYLAYDVMGRDEYEEIGQLIENDFILGKFNGAHSFCKFLIRSKLNELISPIVLSRALFTEEELKKFAKERGKCQYVICGAGMDTFSFRNDNPQIEVSEIENITSKAGYLFDEHLDPKKIHNRFFKDRDDGQRAFENIHYRGDRYFSKKLFEKKESA